MVDGVLQIQAAADSSYFLGVCGRMLSPQQRERVGAGVLDAYRWQYIVSGVTEPRFARILGSLVTSGQAARMQAALAPLMG